MYSFVAFNTEHACGNMAEGYLRPRALSISTIPELATKTQISKNYLTTDMSNTLVKNQ